MRTLYRGALTWISILVLAMLLVEPALGQDEPPPPEVPMAAPAAPDGA